MDVDYLMSLWDKSEEVKKNFPYGMYMMLPTKRTFAIYKYSKYMAQEIEMEWQQDVELERSRIMEKD